MDILKITTAAFGKIVGEKTTTTTNADVAGNSNGHSMKFYLANEAGVETAYWLWVHVTGLAELNPVTGAFKSIEITIASGSTDAVIAGAIRAALVATPGLQGLGLVGGATNQFILTCRWPFNTTNAADVDTGWGIVTTTAGSATVALNAGIDASAGSGLDYVVRPFRAQTAGGKLYFRQINLTIFDSAFTDGTTFGAIAGLTNGVSLLIRDINQLTIATLVGPLKNNTQLLAIAHNAQQMGTIGWFLRMDLVALFGGEVPIDGGLGQELCLHLNDNLAGLDGFYATAYGHATSTP